MAITIDDTKRIAIAMQLAEMKALQNVLISNDQLLMGAIDDTKIRQRLQEMLEQDQQNLDILDTVMIQYGVQGELKESVRQRLADTQSLMEDSKLTLSEKVLQHELLKHQQTMAGLTIHKAAQVVGADVEAAIAPLHTVNFENRAHQEQLKGMLEILGVRELTGQEADQGLWARVEDAIAALTGVAGSVVTRTDDEMSIRDLLLMDHSKSDILFAEILGSDDPQKIQEYFGQLYQDVKIHGLAEEQVLYPAVRPYYKYTEEIIDQTDHVIEMLDEVRSFDPSDPDFKTQVKRLRQATREHIDHEENNIFPTVRENFSHEQQKQMATEFKAAKSKLQDQQNFSAVPLSQVNQSSRRDREKPQVSSMNNSIPWKLVFQTKAVINWVEAVIFLVADRWIRELLNTEPLANPEYSQMVYGLVFIIGIGYWWVGRDISQNHDIVRLGILAQSSVFAVLAYHTLLGSLHPFYLISGVIDLTFAILFIWFLSSYSRTRETAQTRQVLE
ncbi:MAG: hemerythrin domain-containing protein [Myxacorys californica WJT36-NPBG1]|jgi:hemerythrin superfamily protein|nr:hemerythrin domain-containing protein [Myxacorys californica WJT36-NPBG1]